MTGTAVIDGGAFDEAGGTDDLAAGAGAVQVMDVGIDEAERHRFAFTGSGGEYFRIWIVNVLLTVVTLYVYSAWAKVRTNRYFHGNTVLDGSAFEYHARPLQILAGRIVAVVLFALATFGGALHPYAGVIATAVLFAVLPWAVWRSTMFNARMTSYRNVRFGFDGKLGRMYLYLLVLPFLPLLVAGAVALGLSMAGAVDASGVGAIIVAGVLFFYLFAPWAHAMIAGYLADNYRYGRASFAATVSTARFYAIYVQSFALSIAVFVGVGAVVAALLWGSGLLEDSAFLALLATEDEAGANRVAMAFTLLLYPLLLLTGYFVTAFFRARLRNHLFDGVVVDGKVRLESTVGAWSLWRLLVGNLALLVLTLGLAYPWTKVRLARYFAERTAVIAPGGLHAVVDDERERQSALGEELGDAFDMDMDVGF